MASNVETSEFTGIYRNLAPGEHLLVCPYDRLHKVSQDRMGIHLNKCRSNYERNLKAKGGEMQWLQCRFNKIHFLPAPELACHEITCPDRNLRSETLGSGAVEIRHKMHNPKPQKHFELDMAYEEENWDDELGKDEEGRKVQAVFQYPNIPKDRFTFFEPSGLSEIEKKKWTAQQRDKFQKFAAADPKWSRAPPPHTPLVRESRDFQIRGDVRQRTENVFPFLPDRNSTAAYRQRAASVRSTVLGHAETAVEDALPAIREKSIPPPSAPGTGVSAEMYTAAFDSMSIVSGDESTFVDASSYSDVGVMDWVKDEEKDTSEKAGDETKTRCSRQSEDSDDEFFDANSIVSI